MNFSYIIKIRGIRVLLMVTAIWALYLSPGKPKQQSVVDQTINNEIAA